MHSSGTLPHMRRRVDLKSCREMWYIIYSGHFSKDFREMNRVGLQDKLDAINFLGDLKREGDNLEIYSDHTRYGDVLNIYEYRIDNKRNSLFGVEPSTPLLSAVGSTLLKEKSGINTSWNRPSSVAPEPFT